MKIFLFFNRFTLGDSLQLLVHCVIGSARFIKRFQLGECLIERYNVFIRTQLHGSDFTYAYEICFYSIAIEITRTVYFFVSQRVRCESNSDISHCRNRCIKIVLAIIICLPCLHVHLVSLHDTSQRPVSCRCKQHLSPYYNFFFKIIQTHQVG